MVWGGSFDGRDTIAIGLNAHRLLYPQKQTSVNLIGMSVKCFAALQTWPGGSAIAEFFLVAIHPMTNILKIGRDRKRTHRNLRRREISFPPGQARRIAANIAKLPKPLKG
jgi:hypothetical protein